MTRLAQIALACSLAACGAPAAPVATAPDSAREPPRVRYAVALRLEEAGETEDGTPHTEVSLVRIAPDGARTIETLGTEPGACYHHAQPGALIAARCWWAGFGAEYEVRRTGDGVVALRAEVDEEAGRGELTELTRLDIPDGVELEVLGAAR